MIIYAIRHRDSGKLYIGQTGRTLRQRWIGHQSSARNGSKLHFHCAIRRYGAGAFHAYELAEVTPENCDDAEKFYIALFGSVMPEEGYNIAFGGNRGELNEASRKKISDRMKGNKHAVGAVRSPETRALMGAAKRGCSGYNKGKILSEETRKRMSESASRRTDLFDQGRRLGLFNRGRKHTPEARAKMGKHCIGKTHSPETIQKMSESRKAYHARKKVECLAISS
jgi:group I intron endonuclease